MENIPSKHGKIRLTRLAAGFADWLDEINQPVFSDYNLYIALKGLYKNPQGLYIRNKTLTVETYRRVRRQLLDAQEIARDPDYANTYRLLNKQDLPADELACLVDPFCYISHISAMQRYGLTDRRPEALHLTVPGNKLIKAKIHETMLADYGETLPSMPIDEVLPLKIVHHPQKSRKRSLSVFSTSHYGACIRIRGTWARVTTIGQTFLDTLDQPDKCGGIQHVLDCWSQHASSYLEEIIKAVSAAPKDILKVRAGYILNELMNVNHPKIEEWTAAAQRGGSRVLDSSKPFSPTYSEKWMLSLNV